MSGSAEFALRAQAVVVTSGGIGANIGLVRTNGPARLGPAPKKMIAGVLDHVDGEMLGVVGDTGGRVINSDRMWHYTEGIRNYDPVWTEHGIRILPGPSSFWIDAVGRRLPPPPFPGSDTLATLAHINASGHDHTWFVLNRRIISREFALSGSEQNLDLTGRSVAEVLRRGGGVTPVPVAEFVKRGPDFVAGGDLPRWLPVLRSRRRSCDRMRRIRPDS